jgi:hypothetical protein
VQLTPPLERESLKKALADCLGSPSSPQSPRIPNAPAAPASKESVAADDQDVIELVEVVEEQPVRDRLNAGMGKKR